MANWKLFPFITGDLGWDHATQQGSPSSSLYAHSCTLAPTGRIRDQSRFQARPEKTPLQVGHPTMAGKACHKELQLNCQRGPPGTVRIEQCIPLVPNCRGWKICIGFDVGWMRFENGPSTPWPWRMGDLYIYIWDFIWHEPYKYLPWHCIVQWFWQLPIHINHV